jgi:hypothetical protein
MANDNYYKVSLNSIFITLFGELVIRYNMNAMTFEKYSLLSITQTLDAYDSSYVQMDMYKRFICGGIRRGSKNFLSDFTAYFDCEINELVLLMPMMFPRHKHGLVSVGNFVYAIGGTMQE